MSARSLRAGEPSLNPRYHHIEDRTAYFHRLLGSLTSRGRVANQSFLVFARSGT